MEELLDKISKLKEELDKSREVQNIRLLNKKISGDKKLLEKIKEYKISGKEKIKSEINSSKLYREYKSGETDLNILILKINNKLRKINSSNRGCWNEDN